MMGSSRPVWMSNSQIAERYLAGQPISMIALRCKCPFAVIREILLTQGVRLRSQTEANQLAQEDRRQRRARIRAQRKE